MLYFIFQKKHVLSPTQNARQAVKAPDLGEDTASSHNFIHLKLLYYIIIYHFDIIMNIIITTLLYIYVSLSLSLSIYIYIYTSYLDILPKHYYDYY